MVSVFFFLVPCPQVDARNVGVWRKCISTKVPDMPQGWLDRAGVTIVGETGKHVTNNHDVMSLEVRGGGNRAGLAGCFGAWLGWAGLADCAPLLCLGD